MIKPDLCSSMQITTFTEAEFELLGEDTLHIIESNNIVLEESCE